MKVAIAYPPLKGEKGCPTLGQNRQFQYFKEPTYIYPVVPAYAATLLKQAGHEVMWLDCLAENIPYEKFIEIIKSEKPEVIALETKTPVVKQHWQIINDLKRLSTIDYRPWTVLFGDHVTVLPEESFQNSLVDFILTGGDYDFLLLNLCKNLHPIPYTLHPDNLEPGIWYRENGQINPSTTLRIDGERPSTSLGTSPEFIEGRSRTIKNTGKFQLNHDLNNLPFIDRDLTKWQLYAYKNGNYKRTPGTYIMSGRDCWWAKCTFCSWPTLYPKFRVRSVENVLDEIGILIDRYNIKEIMDDTGTFPVGDWLREFCNGMIERGYSKKIYFDCNMRFGALNLDDYRLMKNAGFRLLLFGLESANQNTLDRINKNLKVEQIINSCQLARRAGLFPHLTIMFGYPWETFEDAKKTFELGSWLLKKGFAYTMQATIVIPYPGSPLFEECKREGWLKTLDWDDYDMRMPVIRSVIPDEKIKGLVQGMYRVSFQPEFIMRRIFSIRDWNDLRYFSRGFKKVFGHIFDFK